jgi:GT2 family glycosyltransferase
MVGDEVGLVIIGRNEGERLRRCLQSIEGFGARIYVDSGSTDGSQALARSLGFTVLDLDTSEEFTAARARNLGIFHVLHHYPEVRFVQTVDGDCELSTRWVEQACAAMREDPRLAVIFGRRRERFPDRNIYHRACEIEWNVPAGPADSCGGDAIFRLAPLADEGGYNPKLIAGEEPDLCYRLRRANWAIFSDQRDMTLHDVDISSFPQWWRRALRAGHGIAELLAIHGRQANRAWNRFLLSGFLWSAVLVLTLSLVLASLASTSLPLSVAATACAAIICLQVVRTAMRARRDLPSAEMALRWSALLLVSKVAQVQGALLYWRRRLTSSRKVIIEYK